MSTSPTNQLKITPDQLCADYLRRRNQLAEAREYYGYLAVIFATIAFVSLVGVNIDSGPVHIGDSIVLYNTSQAAKLSAALFGGLVGLAMLAFVRQSSQLVTLDQPSGFAEWLERRADPATDQS